MNESKTTTWWAYHVNWLPLLALAVAFLAVVTSSIAVFGIDSVNDLSAISYLWATAPPDLKETTAQEAAILALRDASARLAWMTLGLFQTVTFLLCLCLFFTTLHKTIPGGVSCRLVTDLLGIIVVGIALQVGTDNMGWSLDRLTGSGIAYTGIVNNYMYQRFSVPWLKWMVHIANGMAVAVILIGTVTAGATIAPPLSGQHNADSLRARLAQLRLLLTASAIALIVGVAQISAEYQWPAAVVRGKVLNHKEDTLALSLAETLSAFSSSITLAAGGVFTLFTCAVFGTAFLVLERKAIEVAKSRQEDRDMTDDDWRKKRGIALSWKQLYGDMTLILGPFVAGVIGSFVKF